MPSCCEQGNLYIYRSNKLQVMLECNMFNTYCEEGDHLINHIFCDICVGILFPRRVCASPVLGTSS